MGLRDQGLSPCLGMSRGTPCLWPSSPTMLMQVSGTHRTAIPRSAIACTITQTHFGPYTHYRTNRTQGAALHYKDGTNMDSIPPNYITIIDESNIIIIIAIINVIKNM